MWVAGVTECVRGGGSREAGGWGSGLRQEAARLRLCWRGALSCRVAGARGGTGAVAGGCGAGKGVRGGGSGVGAAPPGSAGTVGCGEGAVGGGGGAARQSASLCGVCVRGGLGGGVGVYLAS